MYSILLKRFWFLWLMIALSWLLLPHSDWASWHLKQIQAGQYWRILSGNFCHNNFIHWLMNVAALTLIYFIYDERLSNRHFLLISITISSIGGYALLYANYAEYVGLSGLIHGLLAYAASVDVIKGNAKIGGLVLAGLSIKLLLEQLYGGDPWVKQMIGIDVAINAHLYFAVVGVLMALAYLVVKKASTPVAR
ncbi:rhombosortase [Agarivorans sp. MS3-6]